MPTPVRDRLREAAFELFAEQGYDATTVEMIVERAGVGRTTFFRTFGSKEEVIFPDHDEVLGAIRARFAAASAEQNLLAVSEAARIVLRHYLREGDLARRRYRLTRSVPALRQREIASMQRYQREFREFIRGWIGPAGVTDPDADLQAELMAGAVVVAHNHVLRRWLRGVSDQPEVEFDAAMARLGRLFAASRGGAASPGWSDGVVGVAGAVGAPGTEGAVGGTAVVVLRVGADPADVLPVVRTALEGFEASP